MPAGSDGATSRGQAEALPDCDYMLADVNGDGAVNTFDIDPFVVLLTGGGNK